MQNTAPLPARYMIAPFLVAATCLLAAIAAFNTGHIPSGIFFLVATLVIPPVSYWMRNHLWKQGALPLKVKR